MEGDTRTLLPWGGGAGIRDHSCVFVTKFGALLRSRRYTTTYACSSHVGVALLAWIPCRKVHWHHFPNYLGCPCLHICLLFFSWEFAASFLTSILLFIKWIRTLSEGNFFWYFCFCNVGDQTQEHSCARHLLYHWDVPLALFFLTDCFNQRSAGRSATQ